MAGKDLPPQEADEIGENEGLPDEHELGRQVKSGSCPDGGRPPGADLGRPHPDGYSFVFPFRGSVIGSNYILEYSIFYDF